MLPHGSSFSRLGALLWLVALIYVTSSAQASSPANSVRRFDVPSGEAGETLKRFAAQADLQIVFPAEEVRGVRTNQVAGEMPVQTGIDRLLADTGLTATMDARNGILTVARAARPNAPRAVPTEKKGDRPNRDTTENRNETVKLDEVVVSGSLLSLRRAIAEKRGESIVSDGVSADDVGSLPDFGLGESMQRIPGVAMLLNNGRGEAQFLTVRGLNADYNEVLIDGVALPTTETSRRQVSLDIIPSSLVDRMSAYKSMAADFDGNAIGSLVNLRTRSAFDHAGQLLVSGRATVGFYQRKRHLHDHTPSGQAELTVSNTFGPRRALGVVYSTSYFRRDSSSLDTATDVINYFTPTGTKLALSDPAVGTGIPVPNRRRWLTYDNVRERRGHFLKFEYAGEHDFRVHAAAGYFRHLNDEDRQSNFLAQSSNPTIASATTGSVATGNAQVDSALYLQNRVLTYGDFGFQLAPRPGDKLEANVNLAYGHYHQDARIDTYRIAATSKLAYTYETRPGDVPYFAPVNPDYYYNASNYRQFQHTQNSDDNGEHVLTASLDYAHRADSDAAGFGWKTGGRARQLTRHYDFGENDWLPVTGAALFLSDALDPRSILPTDGRGQHLLVIDPARAQSTFEANRSWYALNSNFAASNLGSDYGLTERVAAAYAMATYHASRLAGNAGLRFEDTQFETTSFTATTANSITTYAPITARNHYGELLPSANLAYDLTPSLKLRLAASRSLSRPNYDQLAGRAAVSDNGAGTVTISAGNPALKPRESTNYDTSLEWYPTRDAMVSAAVFRKEIRHEIVRTASTQTSEVGGVTTVTTTTEPRNLDRAGVDGLELGGTLTRFKFLPAPFDGLGAQTNLTLLNLRPGTLVMSDGTRRRLPALLESARSTLNAALLYSRGAFSAQVSYNRTSPMLYTLATTNAVEDRYYGTRNTFDAQIRYKLDRAWTLVLQAKNLTNDRPARVMGPQQNLIRERLDNGRAWFCGANYLFR